MSKEVEPKLTEVTISVRVPIEVAELIKKLTYQEIDGTRVYSATDAQIARDCLIRGLREIMRERGMI